MDLKTNCNENVDAWQWRRIAAAGDRGDAGQPITPAKPLTSSLGKRYSPQLDKETT